MSATQAAQHAKAAGAKRLMLTHILPTLDREVSRDEAAAAFEGRSTSPRTARPSTSRRDDDHRDRAEMTTTEIAL